MSPGHVSPIITNAFASRPYQVPCAVSIDRFPVGRNRKTTLTGQRQNRSHPVRRWWPKRASYCSPDLPMGFVAIAWQLISLLSRKTLSPPVIWELCYSAANFRRIVPGCQPGLTQRNTDPFPRPAIRPPDQPGVSAHRGAPPPRQEKHLIQAPGRSYRVLVGPSRLP